MQPMTTNYFRIWQIRSTHPSNNGVGTLQGFGQFTRSGLEAATAEMLGFYADYLRSTSPDEEYILQGGNSLGGPWEDIKTIAPLAGCDPRDLLDEEDDDRWGQCMRCKCNLTESENATGFVCEGCQPVFYAEHDAQQARLAEEAEEARRYPEESDDDWP